MTKYSYDALNRLLSITYPGGGTPTVTYSYDPAIANGIGRLSSVANSNAITNYTAYDELGRVTGSNQMTAGQTYSFGYSYNLAGSLTSETYPSTRTVTTGYDGVNRVNTVSGVLNGVTTNYVTQSAYWPHGALFYFTRGNGVWHAEGYNNRLQVAETYESLNNTNGVGNMLFISCPNWGETPSFTNLAQLCVPGNGTNNNGTLQGVTYQHGGPQYTQYLTFSQAFGYDAVNRLTSVSEPGGSSQTYDYDAWGNRWMPSGALSGNTPTVNVFNTNNQITAAGYDAAGNQTVVGTDTLTYDAENRQTSAHDSLTNGTENYFYDGLGRRIEKAGPNGAKVYVYDALGQLAAEYSTTASTPACTTCYLGYDHLGTPRLVTDSSGNVIARHDYLPFGEEATVGRNSQWGAGNDDISQKFTGYERDTETGLDFAQARYYGSALGRFMSPDPMNAGVDLTNPQSWNAYAYVLGNPLNGVDPTGMDAVQPCTVGNPIDVCSATVSGSAPAPVQVSLSQTPENYYQMGWGQGGPLFFATGTASAGQSSGNASQGASPAASSGQGTPPWNVVRTGNYLTLDCDGYRATRSILPQTTKQGIEFGGFLYQNSNGRYSYSNPVAGAPTSIPDLFKSPQSFVSGIVGWFHTHPLVPGFNNDRFSGSDLLITRKEGPGYLGTASGRILKLAIDSKGYPHTTDVDSGACQVP